ncbi:MAG: nitroreductase [Nitrospirae bacterium]|nr:MAG: nitroreductase [Nitrospirota bacterium]
MEKPADTRHPIHDLLKRRWSPRAFSDRPVEPDTLRSLLEAARWAPSSSNEQPWNFLVATKDDQAEFSRLLSCLMEGNILWAQRAPVLMVSVARMSFEEGGEPNRHAYYDVGQAVADLSVQATALGLFVHQMAGFHPDKVRELYGVPKEFEPVAMIALGYPGDPESLPEKFRTREVAPRGRKPLAEFVFAGRWGKKSPLII